MFDDTDFVRGNKGISKLLKISRMTLHRWVDAVPLPKPEYAWMRYNIRYHSKDIHAWHRKVVAHLTKINPKGPYNQPWNLLSDITT